MQVLFSISRFHPIVFSCQLAVTLIQMILSTPRLSLKKFTIHSVFFVIISFYFPAAYSQENTPKKPANTVRSDVAHLSASELLTQAKSIRYNDLITSTKMATEALRIANKKNNHRVSAQAHSLLGEIAQQSKNIVQSMHHFQRASLIYKKINDKRNQIFASLNYAELLFTEKRYNEVDKLLNEILAIAQEHGEDLPIAQTLINIGDSFYYQTSYNKAIKEYEAASKYLSDQSESIQKRLGLTHHKIAQSYKQLKDRDQSITAYLKALNVYVTLNDLTSMARTYNNIAREESYRKNYLTALNYSIRALTLHDKLNDPEGLAKTLLRAGTIYRYLGRYEESLNHIHKAHLYYKDVNDIKGMVDTSNQMGLIYTRLKKFEQARSFYQLTIELPHDQIIPKNLAAALREMAVIDLQSDNYESAMELAENAHSIYIKENDKLKSSLTARIIGNIYRDQNDDIKAITWYRKSLLLAIEIGSKKYQIKSQTPLANLLISKNIDEAINLLKKSVELSIKTGLKTETLYAYRTLKKAEKSRGNIIEALRYAEEELSLVAIIQKEKEDAELVQTKAILDSRKMEMELESLKEKTKVAQLLLIKKDSEIEISAQASKISELELTKNRYANTALAFSLVICLIIAICLYRRFIDSKKRNKELDYLVARDPLTNCYNRRVLFDLIKRDLADPDLNREYCIIMVDIDHFKEINDMYGHIAGDTVILGVANILQRSIRQNDIAARFGGEEFCLILPKADQKQAMRIAEVMRKEIEDSHFKDMTVTCSFGISSIKFNAKTPSELIDQADLALYKSKLSGRNQVTLWNTTLSK